MSVKTLILLVAGLALLTRMLSANAQNLIPENSADLYPLGSSAHVAPGLPHNFARLFVQMEIVPTCTVDAGASVSIRCTRGVPYRAWILNDANPAFGRTQLIDSKSPTRSGELMRIEAQRLDVEF